MITQLEGKPMLKERTLPKAAIGVGDPIMQDAIRRSKNRKRVTEYEKKLFEVQNLNEGVAGDREVQVLNWMLDGKSQRWIGLHMALSATSIKRIKDSIVKMIA